MLNEWMDYPSKEKEQECDWIRAWPSLGLLFIEDSSPLLGERLLALGEEDGWFVVTTPVVGEAADRFVVEFENGHKNGLTYRQPGEDPTKTGDPKKAWAIHLCPLTKTVVPMTGGEWLADPGLPAPKTRMELLAAFQAGRGYWVSEDTNPYSLALGRVAMSLARKGFPAAKFLVEEYQDVTEWEGEEDEEDFRPPDIEEVQEALLKEGLTLSGSDLERAYSSVVYLYQRAWACHFAPLAVTAHALALEIAEEDTRYLIPGRGKGCTWDWTTPFRLLGPLGWQKLLHDMQELGCDPSFEELEELFSIVCRSYYRAACTPPHPLGGLAASEMPRLDVKTCTRASLLELAQEIGQSEARMVHSYRQCGLENFSSVVPNEPTATGFLLALAGLHHEDWWNLPEDLEIEDLFAEIKKAYDLEIA